MKQALEDGTQEAANHLLGDPIPNCWNAERTQLPTGLMDVGPSERVGLIAALLEIPHEGQQVVVSVSVEHRDADLVDACGSSIALDGLERLDHKVQGDPSRQGMRFPFRHERADSFPCVAAAAESKPRRTGTCGSGPVGCSERGSGGPCCGVSLGASGAHELGLAWRLSLAFPFMPKARHYSGSAASPEADEAKDAQSAPSHEPSISS